MSDSTRPPARCVRLLAPVVVFLFFAAPAFADIVVLKNGKRLEGRVVDNGESVVVHTRFGSITVPRAQIESIVPRKTAFDELEEKRAAILKRIQTEQPGAAAQGRWWFELSEWCHEHALSRDREDALRQAIAADPDQPLAREALGYVRLDGRWVTGEERHRAMGLVEYQGQWVTPEARDDAAQAAETARQRDLEARKQDAELRLKQAQAEKAEAELKLLGAQADAQRAERERLEREWQLLQLERERLRARYHYYYLPYAYPYPIVINPPLRRAPITPRKPEPPAENLPQHQHGSELNNGVSGPGIPVLK